MTQGLKPKINNQCHVLIVGSFPGEISLKAQQYYAHPRNHFWKIMAEVVRLPLTDDYESRIQGLMRKGFALWDVAESCKRVGSADSRMSDECPNDIQRLLKKYPKIKLVACNGKKAFKLMETYFPNLDVDVKLLPSSSPAHAKPLLWKVKQWKSILDIRG